MFLGEDELYNTLKKVGFTSDMEKSPSLTLGTYEVNIVELASAYSVLANGGKKVTPHLITKVVDKDNNVLYEYKNKEEVILNSDITFIMSELLTSTYDTNLIDYTYPTCISVVDKITHKYAIKSGSTDTDAWVVGYNPEMVLASWAGYDDNKNVSTDIVGANKTSWAVAMEKYFENNEATWYSIPQNVVGVLVDPVTGNIATEDSKNKKILYYLKGTEPNYSTEVNYDKTKE